MDRSSLIYKVLSNEATETQRKELDEWLSQSEENKIEFNDIKLLWETSGNSDQSFPKNQLKEGLSKIKALMQSKLRRREQNTRTWVLIVLAIVSVLVFTYLLFQKSQDRDSIGRLKFDNVSLEQVINTLEDQYDVHIEFENKKVSACTFTGIFYQTKNVDEVLQTLDEALNLSHKLTGEGEYLVTGTGCSGVQ